MHLSQLYIDWKMAKNPYELHRAIWELFPDRAEETRDFLFRVEVLEPNKGARVLMLSQNAPMQRSEHSQVMAIREWAPMFAKGQRLRFRLRANPVKSIADDSKGSKTGNNGKQYAKRVRVPLIHEEHQHAWLERKLDSAAVLEQLVIHREVPLWFSKANGKQRMAGKVQPVLFDGVLKVREPQALLESLQKGIGPAKSFGCGLLSLAIA